MQIIHPENKLVSIIIPVYNAEPYLDECIASSVNQTYKNIEIILVNDGSSDNSLTICRRWSKDDGRIVVVDKPNGGVSSARNVGLKKAKGDYLLFLDADYCIEPNMVESMERICRETGCLVAFCAFSIFDDVHSVISSAFTNLIVGVETAIKQCFQPVQSWQNVIWAKLFSKKVIYVGNDLLEFDETLLQGEDYLWLIQVLVSGNVKKVACLDEPLYKYRRFSANYSLSNFRNVGYLKRKNTLLDADMRVCSLLTNWPSLFLDAVGRLAKEYSNGEVVIYGIYGRKGLREYQESNRNKFAFIKQSANGKSLLRLIGVHLILYFPFPQYVVRLVLEIADKRRQERLYL